MDFTDSCFHRTKADQQSCFQCYGNYECCVKVVKDTSLKKNDILIRKFKLKPLKNKKCFLNEITFIKKVNFSGLLKYHDIFYFEEGGEQFLQVETPCTNLKTLTEVSNLSEKQINNIIFSISSILSDLHEYGIIYGFLSPNKILLTEKMEPLICDYGLFGLLNDNAFEISQNEKNENNQKNDNEKEENIKEDMNKENENKGNENNKKDENDNKGDNNNENDGEGINKYTNNKKHIEKENKNDYEISSVYISPEIRSKNALFSTKADVFSFGAILYGFLTGKVIGLSGFVPLDFKNPFSTLISQCLQQSPKNRPSFIEINKEILVITQPNQFSKLEFEPFETHEFPILPLKLGFSYFMKNSNLFKLSVFYILLWKILDLHSYLGKFLIVRILFIILHICLGLANFLNLILFSFPFLYYIIGEKLYYSNLKYISHYFMRISAQRGNGMAMHFLAVMYITNELDFKFKTENDFLHFQKFIFYLAVSSYERGCEDSLILIAIMIEEGRGGNAKNVAKAGRIYKKMASTSTLAQIRLANLYLNSSVFQGKENKALELFKNAAENGSCEGMLSYANIVLDRELKKICQMNINEFKNDDNKNEKIENENIENENNKNENSEDENSQDEDDYSLNDKEHKNDEGSDYIKKKEGRKAYTYEQIKKAVNYIERASALKNEEAAFMLGVTYEFGIGREKADKKTAAVLYERATNFGNPLAMLRLAMLKMFGIGTEKNEEEALTLFKKCAESGGKLFLYNFAVSLSKNDNKDDKELANKLFGFLKDFISELNKEKDQ